MKIIVVDDMESNISQVRNSLKWIDIEFIWYLSYDEYFMNMKTVKDLPDILILDFFLNWKTWKQLLEESKKMFWLAFNKVDVIWFSSVLKCSEGIAKCVKWWIALEKIKWAEKNLALRQEVLKIVNKKPWLLIKTMKIFTAFLIISFFLYLFL